MVEEFLLKLFKGFVYIYIYICVYREKDRERERDRENISRDYDMHITPIYLPALSFLAIGRRISIEVVQRVRFYLYMCVFVCV